MLNLMVDQNLQYIRNLQISELYVSSKINNLNGLGTRYNQEKFLRFSSAVVSAEDESMGPVFVKEPPNRIDFSNGTGAVVECQARGNPQPDIIWVRADGTAVGDVPGLRQVFYIKLRCSLRAWNIINVDLMNRLKEEYYSF